MDLNRYIDAYYAILANDQEHNITMSDQFIKNMKQYSWLFFNHVLFQDDFGLRISTHNFYSVLIDLISTRLGMESTRKGTIEMLDIPSTAKYYSFSAHDSTLVYIMAGIGHKNESFPFYASSILIEVYKEDQASYTKWFYNGKPINVNNQCTNQGVCNARMLIEFLNSRLLNMTYQEACNHYIVKAEMQTKEYNENMSFLYKFLLIMTGLTALV